MFCIGEGFFSSSSSSSSSSFFFFCVLSRPILPSLSLLSVFLDGTGQEFMLFELYGPTSGPLLTGNYIGRLIHYRLVGGKHCGPKTTVTAPLPTCLSSWPAVLEDFYISPLHPPSPPPSPPPSLPFSSSSCSFPSKHCPLCLCCRFFWMELVRSSCSSSYVDQHRALF